MANKVDYVRQRFSIVETPQGKGLKLNIEITLYDNGMMIVNGNPMGNGHAVSALRFIAQGMEELEQRFAKRQDGLKASRTKGKGVERAAAAKASSTR